MTDEAVQGSQYQRDWDNHSHRHADIERRIAELEHFRTDILKVLSDQLLEMRNLKWLVAVIALSGAPKLIELLRLVWH